MVDVIDLYMENFDEGKNDNVTPCTSQPPKKKALPTKAIVSARRKVGYAKSAKRMTQLRNVASYVPDSKDYMVVQGMLRSHQLPLKENPCKFSISDKRRMDTFNMKLAELRMTP